jgi:hypothetical protein
MRIVVTHLTRMQRGTICVTGLDVDSGRHVRPVVPSGVLQSRMTAPRGGPFDMATVVDLGLTRPVPSPPEVEDCELTWWHARSVGPVEPGLFWELLHFVAGASLRELFGPALRPIGRAGSRRAITDLGTGKASLGVLIPRGQPRLMLGPKPDGRQAVRMCLSDGDFSLDLSVTDLRLYAEDGARPDDLRVRDVAERLARGVPDLLGVGLTRPFAARPDEPPLHWLQVNNIHLADDPTWRLSPPPATHSGLVAASVSQDDLPF